MHTWPACGRPFGDVHTWAAYGRPDVNLGSDLFRVIQQGRGKSRSGIQVSGFVVQDEFKI